MVLPGTDFVPYGVCVMAGSYFIGIKLIGAAAEQLQLFQREISCRAQNSYGFSGVVSHGHSPLHITLVPPTEHIEFTLLDEVTSAVARRHASFAATLTRPGIFLNDNTIATRCGEGVQNLFTIRKELARRLDVILPETVLHASIARKITPPEQFLSVCAAADEMVLANLGRWPLQTVCYGLTIFQKNESDKVWYDRSYHAFNTAG